MEEVPADKWSALVPGLKLDRLDHLERDGVTIQCINSSDFVVGKQTNFNGPVTIISCTEVLKQGRFTHCKPNEEEVVIEDKVLSPSAAMKVHKLAVEKEKTNDCEFSAGQENAGRLQKLKKLLSIVFAVVCVLILVITIAVVFSSKSDSEEFGLKCASLPGGACIYSGFSWGGRPNSDQMKPLKTPVPYVVLSETHDEFCFNLADCLDMIKIFQLNSMSNASCNFLLGGDGNVYEDRGWTWDNSLGGPTAGKSLRLCFIGEFSEEYATYPQFVVAKTLIRFAVDNNYAARNYTLIASNATSPDDPLGITLYQIIKRWPNFAEKPFL